MNDIKRLQQLYFGALAYYTTRGTFNCTYGKKGFWSEAGWAACARRVEHTSLEL